MSLLFNVALILAGLLLAVSALDKIDGETDIFNKIAKVLTPFNLVIGGAALGIGILFLLRGWGILANVSGILSGLLLLTSVLSKVPAIGESLVKLSSKLAPFKVFIGIASLAFGALRFLGIGIF